MLVKIQITHILHSLVNVYTVLAISSIDQDSRNWLTQIGLNFFFFFFFLSIFRRMGLSRGCTISHSYTTLPTHYQVGNGIVQIVTFLSASIPDLPGPEGKPSSRVADGEPPGVVTGGLLDGEGPGVTRLDSGVVCLVGTCVNGRFVSGLSSTNSWSSASQYNISV